MILSSVETDEKIAEAREAIKNFDTTARTARGGMGSMLHEVVVINTKLLELVESLVEHVDVLSDQINRAQIGE